MAAFVPTKLNQAALDGIKQRFQGVTLSNATPTPPLDPAAQQKAAANAYTASHWYNGGTTATPTTQAQNLAAVINQPGNAVQNNLTPYLSNILNQAKTDTQAQQTPQTGGTFNPLVTAGADAPQTGGGSVGAGFQGNSGGQSNNGMSQGQSPTDLINSIYQSQLAAQQQQNKQNRDNLLAGISGQDDLARQNATSQLNQNDVSGARLSNQLREHMANLGLGQGGDYISQQVAQNTAQGQNSNLINQNLTNSLNGNLAQRNAINNNANASDLAIMQNLQGQQSSNLLNDLYKSRDFGLQQAGITGQYNGQNTMQQNQNNFTNGIQQGTLTGYYNGPQNYGQNQQGYGQNQNTGINGGYQVNGQNNVGYGTNQQGNGYPTGMGVSQQSISPGIRTLAGQTLDLQKNNQQFNQNLQTKQFDLNSTQTMAQLTGKMPDGTPTSAQQQLQLANEWKASDESGIISPELAQLYGIPAGTPTQAAKQFAQSLAIQQQQADTSQQSVNNSFALGNRNADIAQGNQDLARANAFGTVDQASGQQSIDYQTKVQDNLYKQWNESGKAPAGIPGVKEGTPLNSATVQQQQLANAYKTWNDTGVAPEGIPGVAPGTPKYNAVDNRHQNMNESESVYITQLDTVPKQNIKAALEAHKSQITKDVGTAGYTKIYNTYFDSFGNPK